MIATIVSLEAAVAAWLLSQRRRTRVLEQLNRATRESGPLRLLSRGLAASVPIASQLERKVAARLTRYCRAFANTDAFELLVLRALVHIRQKIKQKGGIR